MDIKKIANSLTMNELAKNIILEKIQKDFDGRSDLNNILSKVKVSRTGKYKWEAEVKYKPTGENFFESQKYTLELK